MILPATGSLTAGQRVVFALASVLRVAVGVLWVLEARTKFVSGFGAADISLVVQSTGGNSRVPHWYAELLQGSIGAFPAVAGVGVPVAELVIGVLLILGVGTRWIVALSLLELGTYWMSDQLIAQYPVMLWLGVVVLTVPRAASWVSLTTAVRRRRRARQGGAG